MDIPIYKTIFRYLGIAINIFVFGFAIYVYGLFHNIGNPSKGSFGDVALTLIDFYIWIVTAIFLIIGTFIWKIGIHHNPNISSKEKYFNTIMLRILILFVLIIGFFLALN